MDELGAVLLSDPVPGQPDTVGVTDDLSTISPGPIDPGSGSLDFGTLFGGAAVNDNPVTLTDGDTAAIIAGMETQADVPYTLASGTQRAGDVTGVANAADGGGWGGLTDLFSNLTKVAGQVAQGAKDVQGAISGQPSVAQVQAQRKQTFLVLGALVVGGLFLLRK